MIAEEDRVDLCYRVFAFDLDVQERIALFELSCAMLVHLSSSSRHASSLSIATLDLLVRRQRSLVIHCTKLGLEVAFLARDSMSTTLFVREGF